MVVQVVELSEQLKRSESEKAQLEKDVVTEREERMRIESERTRIESERTRIESENAQLLAALTEEHRLRESHDERIARLQDELAAAQLAREAALGQVSAASGH